MQRGTKATEFSRKSATRYRRNHHRNHHRFWQALDDPGKSFSCVQIATMLGDITLHHINPMLLICRNRGYHFEAHKLTGYRGTSNLGGVGVKFRHADYDGANLFRASRRKAAENRQIMNDKLPYYCDQSLNFSRQSIAENCSCPSDFTNSMVRLSSYCLPTDHPRRRDGSMAIGNVFGLLRYPFKSMLGEPIDGRGFANDRPFSCATSRPERLQAQRCRIDGAVWLNCTPAAIIQQSRSFSPAVPRSSSGIKCSTTIFPAFSNARCKSLTSAIMELRWTALIAKPWPAKFMTSSRRRHGDRSDRQPPGGFFDFARVHIIPSAGLARVREFSQSGQSDVARFRPNLVIYCDDQPAFAENGWTGATLCNGNVAFEVIGPTPRCAIPTLAQGELTADTRLISRLATLNRVDMSIWASSPVLAFMRPSHRRETSRSVTRSHFFPVNGFGYDKTTARVRIPPHRTGCRPSLIGCRCGFTGFNQGSRPIPSPDILSASSSRTNRQ